jgi:putative ABC transport system ATP-binding protein
MIRLEGVSRIYDLGEVKIAALAEVNLVIERGEFLTVMGPSGSGKSTLLHILGMLDSPTRGTYELEGHPITNLPEHEIARIRNQHFGFVFQSFNLFAEFSALENVMMPLLYAGVPVRERRDRAVGLLEKVGLTKRMRHYPSMLSGGEQQRVAIARALANDPALVLADEPTGNLPTDVGMEILSILCDLNAQGVTLVLVTHDERTGASGKRMIMLLDGRIVRDQPVTDRFDPRVAASASVEVGAP